MPNYRGEITWRSTPFTRTQIYLFRQTLALAKYTYGNNYQGSTTCTLWVPTPTSIDHKPGIFLRFSNPNGSCFMRMQMAELQDFSSWLLKNLPLVEEPLRKATTIAATLTEQLTAAIHMSDLPQEDVQWMAPEPYWNQNYSPLPLDNVPPV